MQATLEQEKTITHENEFAYVNVMEIDPNFQTLEDGLYNLRLLKIDFATFTYKNDTKSARAGDTGTRIPITFQVVDHEKYSGRQIYETLWPNDFTWKCLHRIANATGVVQEPGEPLDEYFKKLSQVQPVAKYFVEAVPDVMRDGTPNEKSKRPDGTAGLKNQVAFKKGVSPA